MPAPAKPFGRRNLPSSQPSPRPAASRCDADQVRTEVLSTDSTAPEDTEAYLQFTAALAQERQNAGLGKTANGPCIVPKSGRAALLAGLVVACLHASVDLGTSIAIGHQLGTFSIDGHALPIVPLILLGSLWSGARSSVISLFFVRAILAPLQATHIAAYAACGGLVALAYALIAQMLGWGDAATLPIDVGTGLAGGFFYRLFAGTRPA